MSTMVGHYGPAGPLWRLVGFWGVDCESIIESIYIYNIMNMSVLHYFCPICVTRCDVERFMQRVGYAN